LIAFVDAEQPAGRGPRVAVQAGLGGDHPAQLSPLGGGQLAGAGDEVFELGEHAGADASVAFGAFGVVADHEPLGTRRCEPL